MIIKAVLKLVIRTVGRSNFTFQDIKHRLQRWQWYRSLHLAYTGWRAQHGGLPDWEGLLKSEKSTWRDSIFHSVECPGRILIATGTGGHLPSLTLESLLGVALTQRNTGVDFLLCDGVLPACSMCEINWYTDALDFAQKGPVDRCQSCHAPAFHMLDSAGLSHFGLGGQLTDVEWEEARQLATSIDRQDISAYVVEGISVGEHALAGALRFYARGELDDSVVAEAVLRRYFEAALLTYHATRRLLVNGRYKVAVLNHGIYVPQGVIAETARQLGVRVVTWHPAYRRGCFIFNHDETYHHGLLTESISSWDKMRWGDVHKNQIEHYLRSRWVGKQDWVRFHRDPEFDLGAIQRETGLDLALPTIGLLTNVVWDAQLHYQANAFPSMLDWLRKTIAYFERRPDLQLLIRVHPAEITGTLPTRQPAVDEIRRAFPRLPANVFIITPESRLSTYVAMAHCNAVVIYGTKTGVELAATGVPVIVAGEAWIRGKGVTLDASSEADYFRLLDTLPLPVRLDDAIRERALKYAYHFFFRRMIPLECVEERKGWPPFGVAIRSLSDLSPGSSQGLDVVCDGILAGTPFIYPAEEMVSADAC